MDTRETAKGILFIITAPSGAGKSSIMTELLTERPDIMFSVSVTTRAPRPGEIDGVHYRFIDDAAFDRLISEDAFVEWAVVHDRRYGTLTAKVREALDQGRVMLFDTDTVGAFNIKKKFPEAVLIFILPPSPEILSERLRKRNTESEEIIDKRLAAAPKEIGRMRDFDYIIINDTIREAVRALLSIIDAEKNRTDRIIPTLNAWRDYINGYERYGR